MGMAMRILHLADNPDNQELIRQALVKEDMACELVHVETRVDFLVALKRNGWDLILADCMLPSSDGLSALALSRERCPDVPFIFVAGAIGEDAAIAFLKAGATDYVQKHHLSRLAHVVPRDVCDAAEIYERRTADEGRTRLEE